MSKESTAVVRRRVIEFLSTQLTEGSAFVKSRHIADEVDYSVKQIGSTMATLEANSSQFRITRWGGNSDGTTWYVERQKEADRSNNL